MIFESLRIRALIYSIARILLGEDKSADTPPPLAYSESAAALAAGKLAPHESFSRSSAVYASGSDVRISAAL